MELVNELYGYEAEIAAGKISDAALADIQRKLVLLLAPFAPYLAAELWEALGETDSLLRHPWPGYEEALAREDEIEIPVQINGKNRSRIVVPAGSSDEFLRERALADEKIRSTLNGRQVVRVIVVPDKLVNLVVK